MRNLRLMLAVAALLTLGIAPWAAAQMMNGNHDHSSMDKADTTSQPGMMANMGTMNMSAMMGDMSERCKMMSTSFTDLESNFEKMMKMNDMTALKTEMKKHLGMMQKMHEGMTQQRSICQNMMSKMGSGGMHEMMGMGQKGSGSSE